MRSQASKSSPTKGAVNKTQLKTKRTKKKTVAKKIKKIIRKPLQKKNKKNVSKNDKEAAIEDKNESHLETRASTSKSNPSQSASSAKKIKKDPKEKKDPVKTISDNPVKKTILKTPIKKKPVKKPQSSAKPSEKSDESKYKLNKDEPKKKTSKICKTSTIIKKGKTCPNGKKDVIVQPKEIIVDDKTPKESFDKKEELVTRPSDKVEEPNQQKSIKSTTKVEENIEKKETTLTPSSTSMSNKVSVPKPPETPKQEIERPPKFFTSSRSPRMVDIDVKCCKNSKGNLSVSERFVSLKCEVKSNEDKKVSNTLVSQGPEIDVYTFTEKVDSPKSILSDIRNPINQNIGRVRPIARVKGTVMDKKTESERKKFSPHRPIEEVVKQLKAKKSEEVSANQGRPSGSFDFNVVNTKDDEAPKPIVSKSYKMVARKSSVTGIPFSPIKFLDSDVSPSSSENTTTKSNSPTKKTQIKVKKKNKSSSSDDELESSKFSLNTQSFQYSSSEEYDYNESNDDTKESSTSDTSIAKKPKNKRYKKITDSAKKTKSSELKELSKDSLVDLKDDLLGNKKKGKRPHHRPLHKYWKGPKKQRMALLNAKLVVQNLLANEFQTNMDLGLMKTVAMQPIPSTSKRPSPAKKKEMKPKETEKHETTSESEYENSLEKKDDSSDSSDDSRPQRTLREVPGIRSAGKYWDPKSCSSSSEDSELETKKKITPEKKKTLKSPAGKSDSDKPPAKIKKSAPVKKKRNRNEVNMDFKDMVVQKRMASLNASAMIELSYEKRSPKSNKEETTTDSGSDESFSQKPKNGVGSGVKSESKNDEPKKEPDSDDAVETDSKQKVEVIVNQDTDVTITGVYSTHHHHKEGGFCTVSGMQYRISSTSHTQTTATTNCEKECSRDDGARYTPLSALSSMQPPAEHAHTHPPHPVPELGGLNRRAGCSSAFSAPSPSAHHDPGYYQPAGPLIKETNNEDRALARYHPPHYHAPHPQMLPQYGPPYYPDLCYGRYYRPPGPPYPMQPPHTQADSPMGGIGGEPYPPPQYYGGPPCYQHSPQRIPYVEYRGCPCPLNACPKNVLIGPATGKAPAGAGPDVPSALAQPGAAFRSKVRACALDAAADNHGSGKDPPLESEPPAGADVPHPCPVPAIGGASPKRELFDVRDNIRIASEVHGPGEAIGPPSPARGSAGVCAPQPPPSAPRRARLGKAMARRSLAGDDTQGLLLSVQQPAQAHSDADDDVVEISSPPCAPIDLSSSDERSTPLVDIKKENEGPTFASARKPDAQALREHNSTAADTTFVTDSPKAVKRRYSRPKLEIDMKDTQLEEGCKTNGIGEHVKLIKRRKVSGDPPEPPRVEMITKESKKKPSQPRRIPKSPPAEKKNGKRKLDTSSSRSRAKKKILLESPSDENPKVNNNGVLVAKGVQLIKEKDDLSSQIPKTKSALLLDNLIRKNSIDRADAKGYASDKELNPAELFLPPIENNGQNCAKRMLNINNNVVENATTGNGVRPNTIAAVTELIEKKLAYKNACKLEKVDSKVTHKSVLKPPTVRTGLKEDSITLNKCDLTEINKPNGTLEKEIHKLVTLDKENELAKEKVAEQSVTNKIAEEITKPTPKDDVPAADKVESQKLVERKETVDVPKEATSLSEVAKMKRCKMTEMKAKNVEKVVKLLVSKRPAIKTDEATLVVEEACASPVPSGPRRAKRRGGRRGRRLLAPAALPDLEPRAPPRWSNGWNWDGEHHLSKVYLNNDSRLDRMARCWSRMTHTSGDKVSRGDCVLLRASVARAQPFVARVASLWENPEDGEMMVSLVWYYRPEHTDRGRQPADAPDEVFASRHRDANSVACIEDKCYVLTFNEYCRYRKRLKAADEGVTITPTIVPPLPTSEMNPAFAPNDSKLPPSVSPELVLFCRKIYDFRSKKIQMPNK